MQSFSSLASKLGQEIEVTVRSMLVCKMAATFDVIKVITIVSLGGLCNFSVKIHI